MNSALAFVEQGLKDKDSHMVICTLSVARGLAGARKRYESMGFVAVAENHYTSDDGRKFHELVMRRDLVISF